MEIYKLTAKAWVVGLRVVLLAAAFISNLTAATLTQFDEANRLYEQRKYPEAIARYQSLLTSGLTSPAIHFNLGNAYFRNDQMGEAVFHYRRAERLAPRDPDIRANLQFARGAVAGTKSWRAAPWQRVLEYLRLNEITILATGALWLWLLLLALRQYNPAWKPSLKGWTWGMGTLLLLSACLLLTALQQASQQTAIIVQPEAVIRFGPLEESQTAFVAKDGTELKVLESKGEWLQVLDGSQRSGWIPRQAARVFP